MLANSIVPDSTRPVSADISVTYRRPRTSVATCTTKSTLDATVGTTKSPGMFCPASSGSVHNFVTASRALFAWRVLIDGIPEFIATSRSSDSACRTSPTIKRVGRIRNASRIKRRKGISPVPSKLASRVCIAIQSG